MAQVFLSGPKSKVNLPEMLGKIELQCIKEAMKLDGGNQTKAAERLGIKRSTLCEKIKRFGLKY